MLWFRHETRASQDAKVKKLIMRHGVAGYGFYFAVVERIAAALTSQHVCFELEDDDEILAHDFKLTLDQVKEIRESCLELGLLGVNPENGRLTCYGLIDRLDNSISQSPEIHKIKASNNFQTLKDTAKDCKPLKKISKSLKQRRGEERREEESTTTTWRDELKFLAILTLNDPETGEDIITEVYLNGEFVYARAPDSEEPPHRFMTKQEFFERYPAYGGTQ